MNKILKIKKKKEKRRKVILAFQGKLRKGIIKRMKIRVKKMLKRIIT